MGLEQGGLGTQVKRVETTVVPSGKACSQQAQMRFGKGVCFVWMSLTLKYPCENNCYDLRTTLPFYNWTVDSAFNKKKCCCNIL